MTLSQYLYAFIIYPIRLIFEFIYSVSYRVFDCGWSIICVSIALSLFCLPLYNAAEAKQKEQLNTEKKLKSGLDRIKKTFSGDERFMMIQTFYKENHYHPLMSLRSSLSLLIEIPFFIAAYTFLANLNSLKGESFYFIRDFGKPDALFTIKGFTVNVLPIAMTLINLISGAIYTKGFNAKERVKLYAMALVFLVLLYNSPSGLVLYWTMNNVFSLGKNIVQSGDNLKRLARHKILLCMLPILAAVAFDIRFLIINPSKAVKLSVFFSTVSVMPLFFVCLHNRKNLKKSLFADLFDGRTSLVLFSCSVLLLAVLTGLMIPANLLASAPVDFFYANSLKSPVYLVYHAFCIAAGIFLLWIPLVYFMLDNAKRNALALLCFFASVFALVNYIFFGKNLGTISPLLKYYAEPVVSKIEGAVNIAVILLFALLFFLLLLRKKRIIYPATVCLASLAFISLFYSFYYLHTVKKAYKDLAASQTNAEEHYSSESQTIKPVLHLSKNDKNVIVIMLDRAIGAYFPYIVEESPELKKELSGFTFYRNTLSYGIVTVFGAPPLFGGYEYTPAKMNERDDVSMIQKHNESLLLMPALFSSNGWNTTVADLPYANYSSNFDPSIFKSVPGVKTLALEGNYTAAYESVSGVRGGNLKTDERNFILYSIMKCAPLFIQKKLYKHGEYWNPEKSTVANTDFLNAYAVLNFLPEMTAFDSDGDTFLVFDNNTTHEFGSLNPPDYTPASPENCQKSTYEKPFPTRQYDSDIAAILRLSEWFQFLKANGVYDNSRIIIVSDHGTDIYDFPSMNFKGTTAEAFNPLLLIKDFNATGDIVFSDEFMTNADVPTEAFKDVIENPVNPFTGNPVDSTAKQGIQEVVFAGHGNHTAYYHKKRNTFDTSKSFWYTVHDNIFDPDNWELVGKGSK